MRRKIEPLPANSGCRISRLIATVSKPALCILSRDGGKRLNNGFFKRLASSGPGSSQEGFEFRKGFLNRGEIRRVGGQKPQLTPASLNGLPHLLSFVDAQIIHDDDLPWSQARSKNLLHIELKGLSLGGSFQDQRLAHPLSGQRSNQGRIASSIAWNRACCSLPFGGSRIAWSQGDIGAAFINEDQLARIQLAHLLAPGDSGLLIALAGCQ